jgi:hypothetical protein
MEGLARGRHVIFTDQSGLEHIAIVVNIYDAETGEVAMYVFAPPKEAAVDLNGAGDAVIVQGLPYVRAKYGEGKWTWAWPKKN